MCFLQTDTGFQSDDNGVDSDDEHDERVEQAALKECEEQKEITLKSS